MAGCGKLYSGTTSSCQVASCEFRGSPNDLVSLALSVSKVQGQILASFDRSSRSDLHPPHEGCRAQQRVRDGRLVLDPSLELLLAVLDREELDVEGESRLGRDDRGVATFAWELSDDARCNRARLRSDASLAPSHSTHELTVAHLVGDGEDTLLANAHVEETLLPALDDHALSDCACE